MTQLNLNKGEFITIVVETLESYPVTLKYEDVFGYAINKIGLDHNNAMQVKAKVENADAVSTNN